MLHLGQICQTTLYRSYCP